MAGDDVLERVGLGDVPTRPTPVASSRSWSTTGTATTSWSAGETWTYTCQGTITEPTVDLAEVVGHGGSTIGEDIPVFDFATAQVDPFHPGIAVEKSAEPSILAGPGGVTYTYKVRNTGDVPLDDVEDRITDDTCTPVTYQSGDKDGDGLLDSPKSIFEDALDETWIFTCTTMVAQDTVNTVVVEGTPVDPEGAPLCGADTVPATDPCDVTGTDQARVDLQAIAPATVQATQPLSGLLPDTGAPPWLGTMVALGLAMLASGGWLVRASERRRGPRQGSAKA